MCGSASLLLLAPLEVDSQGPGIDLWVAVLFLLQPIGDGGTESRLPVVWPVAFASHHLHVPLAVVSLAAEIFSLLIQFKDGHRR